MLKDDIIQYVNLAVLCIAVIWWNDVNAQERDCIIYADPQSNENLQEYLRDNHEAEQVDVFEIINKHTLQAMGNTGFLANVETLVAYCLPAKKAYTPNYASFHCVDHPNVYDGDQYLRPAANDEYGRLVCQGEERLKSKWSNGHWNEVGEWIPYDKPCDKESCADVIVRDSLGNPL
jgi:hypothetical protein